MNQPPQRSPADATIAEIVATLIARGRKPGEARVLVGALLAQITVDELSELIARPPRSGDTE